MKIVSITVKGESHAVIKFDESNPITVLKSTVYDFGLRKGDEISEEQLSKLSFENETIRVKDTVLRFLSMRSHSVNEIRIKLKQRKYSEEVISNIIATFTESGLLDDRKFTIDYFNDRVVLGNQSIMKFKSLAMHKGVNSRLIDEVINLMADEEINAENIRKVALKKLRILGNKSLSNKELYDKMGQYLYSLGFKVYNINQVLHEMINDK